MGRVLYMYEYKEEEETHCKVYEWNGLEWNGRGGKSRAGALEHLLCLRVKYAQPLDLT